MTRSDVGLGAAVRQHLRGHFVSDGQWRRGREKRGGDKAVARTKTDTGRRDEYSQALERTLVKELGNITP